MPKELPASLTDILSGSAKKRCILCDELLPISECCRTYDDLSACDRFLADKRAGGFARLASFFGER